MPYISRLVREDMASGRILPESPGELNYAITKIIVDYWNRGPKGYQCINNIVGALEGAKLEFYRRVVVPYEDGKREENGDVYV